jgi:hypothetical protein
MAAAEKNRAAAAVIQPPYILINEDIPTQKIAKHGEIGQIFFFGHLQRN